jgi:DNA-binding NtrC family response regulator
MQPATILIVDDERALRASLRRLLAPDGFQILEAGDGSEAIALVARSLGRPVPGNSELPAGVTEVPPIDIIVSDVRMPKAGGMELLRYVRQHAPHIEVLLLTAFGEVADAVAALKLGAFDFIEKPFDSEMVRLEIRRAHLLALERRALKSLPPTNEAAQNDLVGASPAMTELRALVARVGASDVTVLIQGESGTGKELVARALHAASPRARGPFVAVHCGAIPETLIESELFGHVKGAFTGAANARDGRFAQAEGGTIFLDEIGETPPLAQVKLLRVLQERTYDPVGSTTPRKGDFRVITASNRDLTKAIAEGTFRQDLFYRLNVVPITVPTLRERTGDVATLCDHFIARQNRQRKTSLSAPTASCGALLSRYAWPGNVRELEHLVERIAVLKGEGAISESDLPTMIRNTTSVTLTAPTTSAFGLDLNGELGRLESELIRTALKQSGGNKNRAAQMLGLNRTTLIEKIKRLGLQPFADSLTGGTLS